jgi:hypothetical protein
MSMHATRRKRWEAVHPAQHDSSKRGKPYVGQPGAVEPRATQRAVGQPRSMK